MPKIAAEAVKALQQELKTSVEDQAFDHLSRLLYSTDASIYQMMPVGIVWPKNDREAAAAVQAAVKHQIPVLPRGGGSSLAGQAINQALILDFSRHMDTVLELDPERREAVLQPGVVLGQFNRQAARHGLMFGPDPASADRATIGGIIGNNATGAHSILYGMAHDHLLEANVILSDGSQEVFQPLTASQYRETPGHSSPKNTLYHSLHKILDTYRTAILDGYPRTFRNVAGYNLKTLLEQQVLNPAPLLAGSEGTLAILTSAKIKLVPRPEHTHLYLVHYQDLRTALESVPEILKTNPSAVELIDRMLIQLARANPAYEHLLSPIQEDPAAVLLVEYQGADPRQLSGKTAQLSKFGLTISIPDRLTQNQIWKARKVGLGILQSTRGDSKPTTFIEDAAVPVEHLADYAVGIREFAREIGVGGIAFYAHASAGCLHIRPMVNLKSQQGVQQMRQLAEKSLDLVLKFGGTTTGEHGEGLARGEFMPALYGPELTAAFREVKQVFDPHNLFNPGKIIDPPAMDSIDYLRYGPDYSADQAPDQTRLNFQEEQGFSGAVEMCNGAGVCRQLDEGVMCPSFQATRDEKHSTRGRANALRAAMTGKLGTSGMTSRELYQVLDLCLSCQACLSECPSTVDISKLKAEFLHQYYQEHGVPLRNRVFANIEALSKLSRPIAPLVNFFLEAPTGKLFTLAGIHPRRSFPRFQSRSFTDWYRGRKDHPPTGDLEQVVFFHDTYLEYNYPHIGRAAVNILEKAGVDLVILNDKKDSGRPAYSKGMLDKAGQLAEHNLKLLAPYARKGIPILGCEPSVMIMLTKEYQDLHPGEDSRQVAGVSQMVERYLIREIKQGRISFEFDHRPRRVLYHGHCQQKANFGTEDTVNLLNLIPECTVVEIDAGCCGMAGAFGYEKEHYQISLDIAELRLAPQVRQADPETLICASGTSCREQILHTTGRDALHPLEIFAASLI